MKKTAVKKNAAPSFLQGKSFWRISAALILGIGLYQAIRLRWVSDDAFITFRYVQNFVAGHGIVYNAGEYVEGYTHFLWLLVLSAVKIIGFDPVEASKWLGILCYAGILSLFIPISKKELQRTEESSKKNFSFPLAAALLALNYDMNVWASGGLETALYTLFLSLAFFTWFYTDLPERKKILASGSILLLATLTRPDGALFIATAVFLLAIKGIKEKRSFNENAKRIGFFILPSVIIGIPYLLWKYSYYGDIFPTPYYAKSASGTYFEQGFYYILLFFRIYISAAAGLVIVAVSFILNKGKFSRMRASSQADQRGSPIAAASIFIAVYLLLYVTRVGGDFMFARFLIPVLPLLYFIIEAVIDRFPPQLAKYRMLICIVLLGATPADRAFRERILFHYDAATKTLASNWDGDDGGTVRGIADERWAYTHTRFTVGAEPVGSLDTYVNIGKLLAPIFEGLPVKVVIMGGQNSIAYYADFANCIDIYGLTDSYIAHLPITKRGRIGHEKEAPSEYLLKRGVNLQFFGLTGKPPEYFTFNVVGIEIPQFQCWLLIKIINYDKHIMQEFYTRLGKASIKAIVPVYEGVMPYYLKEIMPKLHSEEAATDYKMLQNLYFKKYPDQKMQDQLLDSIARKKKEESVRANIK
jgi:hypothetical protein